MAEEEVSDKCLAAAKAVFGGAGVSGDMPTTTLSADDFTDGVINICDLMVKGNLASSKSEARRLVNQGGVSANDAKVTDVNSAISADLFGGDGLVVKKGKKVFHRFIIG